MMVAFIRWRHTEAVAYMRVHDQMSSGHFELETPFKSHYKVFGNVCTILSNGILCNGLSSWIAHKHRCWSPNLKPPSIATRNLCWAETLATDQTSPLHNSRRHDAHYSAAVTMYFSVSKTNVLMESPTNGTLCPYIYIYIYIYICLV